MKPRKPLLACILGMAMLTGCGQSKNNSIANCTMTTQNIKIDYQIEAPSEEAEIDELNIKVSVPLDIGRQLLGNDSISNSQMKEAISQMTDVYKGMLTSTFGLPEEDITIETTDNDIFFVVKISDIKAFQENPQSGLGDTSLIFNEVVTEMTDQGFTCD